METPANSKPANRRRHRRVPVKVYADLHWEGAGGQMNFARARVVDVSEGGVGISFPGGGLRVGLSVNVRIEQFGFAEYGIVNYARGATLGVQLRFDAATLQELERWKKCIESAEKS
jgi:c-di-GMP-binding flagellar brake protein YcgR